jgi:uncharacterized protein YcbK (DUF882 family)
MNREMYVCSLSKQGNRALAPHFKVREFACADGSDAVFAAKELVDVLEKIRTHFGNAVVISSGYRTAAHNKKVGGEKDSQHLYGLAADIAVQDVSPQQVANYAEVLLKNTGGIGRYATFTHIDVRKEKSRWNG